MENEVLETIRNRRSTRKYKEVQITKEELQTIIDAGIQAPSANNSQSWHFTVIQNKDMVNAMSDKTKEVMLSSDNKNIVSFGKGPINIFYNAPTVIIVSGKEEVESSLVDCSAAIENMLIACQSIKLGAVWIGFVRYLFTLSDEVEKFNLPDGYKPFYAVSIGYKSDDSISNPLKRNTDVVNYIR